MKKIKLLLVVVIVTGLWTVSQGSFARIESMGKSATFFMDDVSIFDNPANINVFPNFLIGEMGSYLHGDADRKAIRKIVFDTTGAGYYNPKYNRDPENPWFGGIFSYSIGKKEEGNLYPQITLGGAFNRKDTQLYSFLPDSVVLLGANNSEKRLVVPEPVTNFDGFLGFTFANGGMVGSHIYLAIQEGAQVIDGEVVDDLYTHDINSYLLKGDLGLNWPLARNVDGELSFGFAAIQFGPKKDIDTEYSFFIKARSFSTLEIINGELVPIINYSSFKAPGVTDNSFNAGLGVNASLDRGFFWLGLQYLSSSVESMNYTQSGDKVVYDRTMGTGLKTVSELRGGQISFGIERNIWWDWLVVRVGGRKMIASQKRGGGYYIITNPEADGTINDHVGWGFGLNVEEKLKIDVTMAEDFIYTGGNLLSGLQHHIFSRLSATYSF